MEFKNKKLEEEFLKERDRHIKEDPENRLPYLFLECLACVLEDELSTGAVNKLIEYCLFTSNIHDEKVKKSVRRYSIRILMKYWYCGDQLAEWYSESLRRGAIQV